MEYQSLENNRAKELFFIFYGNEFFMWKDGYLEEYKSYNVPEEEKLIWRTELSQKLYSELEVKHESTLSGLIHIINFFGEVELLEKVINFISVNYNQADSFLKIRYAEDLFDMIEKSKFHDSYPSELIIRTKKLVIEIINDVLSNEIRINGDSGKILEFNQEMSDNDYLKERAKNLLKRVKKV